MIRGLEAVWLAEHERRLQAARFRELPVVSPLPEPRPVGRYIGNRPGPKPKLSPEQVQRMRERRAAGESWAALSAEYGLTERTLQRITKRGQS